MRPPSKEFLSIIHRSIHASGDRDAGASQGASAEIEGDCVHHRELGGPGSGRPKGRHRTVESCLALDADCDSVALGFVVDSTMIQFKPQ